MDLDQISDRLEIEALLTRYTRAIDTGEWDRLDEVFTPDAQIDYTAQRRHRGVVRRGQAVARRDAADLPEAGCTQLGQVDSQVDGDEATVAAYFHNPMVLPQQDGPELRRGVRRDLPPRRSCVRRTAGARARLVEEVVWKRGL